MTGHKLYGRKKPYSARMIVQLPCFRCGDKAKFQWQVCSDDNLYHPLCDSCDVALNDMVLQFMEHPDYEELIEAYQDYVYGN